MFRLGSTARTQIVWEPGGRSSTYTLSGAGLAQELYTGTPIGSTAHSKLASSSLLSKANVAGVSRTSSAGGNAAMVVVGAAKSSIVQVHSAAIGSASRCCTSACTWNVCSPEIWPLAAKSCSSVYVVGDVQATNTEPSIEHSKL